jgi:O-antigen/teichoic acid export membrane protein
MPNRGLNSALSEALIPERPAARQILDSRFRSDAVISYAGQAASVSGALAFTVLVTKFAGVATFGAFAALVAAAHMLTNLLTFRTNEAVIAFYKRGEASGDLALSKFALIAGVILDLLVASTVLFLYLLGADLLAGELIRDPTKVSEVRLYAICLCLTFLRGTPVAYLTARQKFLAVNVLATSEQWSKVGLIALFVALGRGLNLYEVVLAATIAAGVTTGIAYGALLWGLLGYLREVAVKATREIAKQYVAFSASTFASSSLKAGNQNVDVVVLSVITGPVAVGVYSFLKQFTAPFSFLSAPFAAVAYPRFVGAVMHGKLDDVRKTISRINRRLAWVHCAAVLMAIPAVYAFAWWSNLHLGMSAFVTLGVLLYTAVLSGRLWWTRPLSLAVDPGVSLKANWYGFLLIAALIVPLTMMFDMTGTALMMAVVASFWSWYLGRRLRV